MTVTSFPTTTPARFGTPAPAPHVPAGANTTGDGFFGNDGFTFEDFLDLINPLQHIPIVSTIYRAATGDDISTGARVLGGALFGGILGFLGAVFNAIVAEATGKDIGEHALALFDDSFGEQESAVATNAAPAPADSAGIDVRNGAPGPIPTPAASTPETDGDPSAVVARFGARTAAAGWVLLVLGQALDKCGTVLQARDTYERHHPVAQKHRMEEVDTVA